MIKHIKIKNMFAIKSFDVNFLLSHNRDASITSNQIIAEGKNKIAMAPTFLAKNASGKTSFIKALDYAFRFATKESFIEEMLFYKWSQISEFHDSKFYSTNNTDEHKIKLNDSRFIIEKLFDQISFVGSEESQVVIECTMNRKIKLEISQTSFNIILNNSKIDILNFLDSIKFSWISDDMSGIEIRKKLYEQINDKINKNNYEFFSNFSYDSLITGNVRVVKIREIVAKHKVRGHLQNIIDNFGFDSLKIILKKIDSNIHNLSYNISDKSLDVYIKEVNDKPISANQLSLGTQKTIEIISKSINIFKNGGVIMINEIENGLHLSLIKLILSLFEDENINKNQAQIILTTHNPLIIERGIIKSHNVFMYEDKNFIQLTNLNIVTRTEDKESVIKPKNYYNDYFWVLGSEDSKFIEPKSTISNNSINQIITTIYKHYKFHL